MKDFKEFEDLLRRDRTIRRFDESRALDNTTLERLVELTRYCASGRNLQPLKYRLVLDRTECEKVYPLLAWAGYLPEWDGPEEGERPVAYLVQCLDTRLTKNCLCDDGLQLQAITLGATAMGLGACIIKSFQGRALEELLGIPEWAIAEYVIALGYPKEKVVIVDTDGSRDADIRYYRTEDGVHHVPKRPLTEIIL